MSQAAIQRQPNGLTGWERFFMKGIPSRFAELLEEWKPPAQPVCLKQRLTPIEWAAQEELEEKGAVNLGTLFSAIHQKGVTTISNIIAIPRKLPAAIVFSDNMGHQPNAGILWATMIISRGDGQFLFRLADTSMLGREELYVISSHP